MGDIGNVNVYQIRSSQGSQVTWESMAAENTTSHHYHILFHSHPSSILQPFIYPFQGLAEEIVHFIEKDTELCWSIDIQMQIIVGYL